MSNSYDLKLLIDPRDLDIIRSSQERVTLAKPVNGQHSPVVAWLVFDPLSVNDIAWTETYGVYASNSALQQGATVATLSEISSPAEDGAQYAVASSGVLTGPSGGRGVQPGSYGIVNEASNFPGPMSVGLTQSAVVNQKPFDNAPVSAAAAPANQFVSMTPSLTVFVWLQPSYPSGTIINELNLPYAKATFGGGVNAITMKFDSTQGVFVPIHASWGRSKVRPVNTTGRAA